jgi:hypothetical protein
MEPAQYCIESKENIVRFIQDIWTSTTYPSMTGAHDSKFLGLKKEIWGEELLKKSLFAVAIMPIVRESQRKFNSEYESDANSIHSEYENLTSEFPIYVKSEFFPRFKMSQTKHLSIGNMTIPTYKVNPLEIATDLCDYIGDLESLALKGVSAPIVPEVFDIFYRFNKLMETKYKEHVHFLDDPIKKELLDHFKARYPNNTIIC